MHDVLIDCISISLAITGIYMLCQEDKIFGFVRRFTYMLPQWVLKPVHDCLPCMASLWGIPMSVAMCGNYREVPFMVLIIAGLNTIINKLLHVGELYQTAGMDGSFEMQQLFGDSEDILHEPAAKTLSPERISAKGQFPIEEARHNNHKHQPEFNQAGISESEDPCGLRG